MLDRAAVLQASHTAPHPVMLWDYWTQLSQLTLSLWWPGGDAQDVVSGKHLQHLQNQQKERLV